MVEGQLVLVTCSERTARKAGSCRFHIRYSSRFIFGAIRSVNQFNA